MVTSPQFTRSELTKKYFPIYFYRKHLDIACRDLLGLDLAPHFRLVLRDWARMKPINLYLASRGMGKTVLTGIFYVLLCMLYPRIKLIIVGGGGFRAAKNLMQECEKVILGQLSGQRQFGYARFCMADPKRVVNRDPTAWMVNFSNGSSIKALPLGLGSDGNIIRGNRAHVLSQDEAFLIPTKLYQTVLEPMLNVLYDVSSPASEQLIRNMSIMTSTIDFSFRDFYEQFQYYKSVIKEDIVITHEGIHIEPEDLSIFEWNIDDAYYKKADGKRKFVWGIDYDKLIKKKNLPNQNVDIWLAENKNVAMDISGGYYPFSAIEKCQNICLNEKTDTYPEILSNCSGSCILGIDTAPSSANTAFVVIKVGSYDYKSIDLSVCESADMGKECVFLKKSMCGMNKKNAVIYAYEENKMAQKDRVKKLYELMDRFNIIAIAIDQRGGGHELCDLLRDRDYVKYNVSPETKAVFDPNKFPDTEGMPILKEYASTQDSNMLMAGYLKGLITNVNLLLPRPLRGRPDDPFIFEASGHVETLVNQLVRIKALPAGRSVRFEIEAIDPQSGKSVHANKDLFSALMYGIGRLRELIDEQDDLRRNDPELIPLAMAFNI